MPVRIDEAALGELTAPQFLDPRATSSELHTHLRSLIITGSIPPGTELNQAELARRFKISRIPIREALKMLQQEGLVDVQRNQRAVVRDLEASEVDQLYGVRIALESLGARITAGRLTPEEAKDAKRCLRQMRSAKRDGKMLSWIPLHRHFHSLCTARAGEPLARIILSYSERSERYLRFAQQTHPDAFEVAEQEHIRILDALIAGQPDHAGSLMAQHLASTALRVLADLDGNVEGLSVQEALNMACRGRQDV
ncbi:GntR family transcriptional regulator [Mycobacterium montefiorense]|uniref:GntR family transcriptional regulator n=1 Tax=Mycobacterium montefiorense TaxID=154654 RepID=UPI0021DE9832|nr:GntR family transcriptional regulator [Mycobacterium montefiorense]MCV7427140.1 GntR family transcriptional regulator [Mycobacterium montefiorense]GLE53636.1 GntR family transcriptional regulator [Mycobacterium montefiorense]